MCIHNARAAIFIAFISFDYPFRVQAINRKLNSVLERDTRNNRPNIVWILADDLHYEPGILDNTPNIRRMKQEGLEFPNHVSQSPLCGPSRASMLVGRLPHNTGYTTNAKDDSVAAFLKIHDNSVGKWLTDAGYYTAFLGKYVNGAEETLETSPKGWNHFGGFTGVWDKFKKQWLGGAYTYYNTSQWDLSYDETGMNLLEKDNSEYPIKIWTGVHQADFLGKQTLKHAQIGVEQGRPFFVFTNPLMVHHGYCNGPFDADWKYADHDPWREEALHSQISPCAKVRNQQEFVSTHAGVWTLHHHTPAWNVTAVGQKGPPYPDCCDAGQALRAQYGAQNRTNSMVDLDEMIGVILEGLEVMNVLENTYVIFTSDNGFHLGEHKFSFGKTLPYDHDVHVPMVIRTPKSAARGVRKLPTSHTDITRTIVDLAGAQNFVTPSVNKLDGKSFARAFSEDINVNDWRNYSYSEMFEDKGRTWRNIRFVDNKGHAKWTLSVWCHGGIEIFRVDGKDKYQLFNLMDQEVDKASRQLRTEILDGWLPVINGMGGCEGDACSDVAQVFKELAAKERTHLMPCND